jgi:hypothetical protein
MQVAAFQAADPPLVVVQPQIITATFSNSDFVVSFTTVSGQDYELQGSVDLTSSSWSPLVTNILGTGDIMQITDTNALGQSQRFYRVKSEMSP